MKKISTIIILLSLIPSIMMGQSCTYDADGTGSSSFDASTSGNWTAAGGATCPPTSTFTGDVSINIGTNDTFTWDYALDMTGDMTITLANGGEVIFDDDINVTGNIPVTNGGSSILTVNAGATPFNLFQINIQCFL